MVRCCTGERERCGDGAHTTVRTPRRVDALAVDASVKLERRDDRLRKGHVVNVLFVCGATAPPPPTVQEFSTPSGQITMKPRSSATLAQLVERLHEEALPPRG
jgi:hypothetical protein